MITLVLTAAASAADAGIHKKVLETVFYDPRIYGLEATSLIISNGVMKDITKIAKLPEKFNLMIKDASKVIENEPKEEKCGSLSMLLNTLNAS